MRFPVYIFQIKQQVLKAKSQIWLMPKLLNFVDFLSFYLKKIDRCIALSSGLIILKAKPR